MAHGIWSEGIQDRDEVGFGFIRAYDKISSFSHCVRHFPSEGFDSIVLAWKMHRHSWVELPEDVYNVLDSNYRP